MAALAAIVRIGLQTRARPVALGLPVSASTSHAAARHVLAARASGAGIAARAAVVGVRQSVHAASATALQTAEGVGPAAVVAVGAAAAPVGDSDACRAVLAAHLARGAPTGSPTGAPTLDADPARTAPSTLSRALLPRWRLRLPRGCGQAGLLVAAR
jgi:hypothetical protein